ncbi:MAG: glycosyltransferase family 4 protein [Ruminococcaceae bacterium]|nr:glycosyltransferase family 4 protein [Oscillospiraceae bacterium]
MNILIIDPDILPDKGSYGTFEKAEFLRIIKENRQRHFLLAKEFSSFGANVLLIRPELSFDKKAPIEFYQRDGISMASVRVFGKKSEKTACIKEEILFSSSVYKNSACFGGIFTPDAVICAGTLPTACSAAAKIAEDRNCVLITELACSPKEFLLSSKAVSSLNPLFAVLKKECRTAFEKSDAVIGFFPKAQSCFSHSSGIFPAELPPIEYCKEPSSKAVMAFEKLCAFKEGGAFLLCCAVPLEFGFSIDELMAVCSGFDKKFSLVFLLEGTKKKYYRHLAAEKSLTNVFFAEDIPAEELSYILSAADGVYLSENGFLKGFAPEQDVFSQVFLSGRPVIAAAEHWADFFRKSGGTIITKPRNKESIRLGIKALLEMPCADRDILGESNKSFAEKISFKNFAKEYYSLTDNLVKQKENIK